MLFPRERLVPIALVLAVRVLVWEDGGAENQAIAAFLWEVGVSTAQSHRAVEDRIGERIAALVLTARTFVLPPQTSEGPVEASFWVTYS